MQWINDWIPGGAGIIAIAGLLCLWIGWRGRYIGNEKRCRKCRYDLTGTPPESDVCSECGAKLGTYLSVRIGQHKRRPILLFGGALLVSVSLSNSWSWMSDERTWIHEIPFSFLFRGIQLNRPIDELAMSELISRLDSKELSHIQTANLVALAIQSEAMSINPIRSQWRDLIETADAAGFLNPAQRDAYWRSVGTMIVQARPVIRRGQSLPVILYPQGFIPGEMYQITWTSSTFDIDYGPSQNRVDSGSSDLVVLTSKVLDLALFPLPVTLENAEDLNDGPHTFHENFNVTISRTLRNGGHSSYQFNMTATAPFTIVPPGAPTVKLSNAAELRQSMKSAFTVALSRRNNRTIEMPFNCIKPLVAVVFKILLRIGNDETFVGEWIEDKSGSSSTTFDQRIAALNVEHADIVLRPDPEIAESRTFFSEIWGEDIVFSNVPITDQAKNKNAASR